MTEGPSAVPRTEKIELGVLRDRLLREFGGNRLVAHEVLFAHRHPIATPRFHLLMQQAFHSSHPLIIIEAFRDAAKSTVAEEAIAVGALYEDFHNCVILGASYPRAKEKLAAVKNEFTTNQAINQLFGPMEGDVWGEGRIVLANGVCITALGAGMSMRGMRWMSWRPDFWVIDDLEDEESVKTPEARSAMMTWLYRTFLPACAKESRGRMLGNRLDSDALIVRLSKDPDWKHLRFPIMHQDPDGREVADRPGLWVPTWAEKFSLDDIVAKQAAYARLGLMHAFNCEYMCEAETVGTRLLEASAIKVVADKVRAWEAAYAAFDPARTANATSAMTGWAVFSWVGSRLVVWEGDARLLLPDAVIDAILDVDDRWSPVELGVEATGLEEFIMQPLRHAALKRRQLLPLRRLIPPRGKDTFIRGLQPFFKAGEIEFVNVSEDARSQLLAFPTGRRDFPNALAYALHMRPGLPIYDAFSRDHVVASLVRRPVPWWLVVNATVQFTTAALVRLADGALHVAADWVREGPPGDHLDDIVKAARLEAGTLATPGSQGVRLVAPPVPQGHADVVGLRTAVRQLHLTVQNGGAPVKGREALRELLQRRKGNAPMVHVLHSARWTLNAFAGGYAYEVNRRGQLAPEPVANVYRVLMEGLESFVAGVQYGLDGEADDGRRTAVAADGRVYTTIRAVPQ